MHRQRRRGQSEPSARRQTVIFILAGAVIGALVQMPLVAEVALEYVLGFAFGWTVFQSLFMQGTAGGSYRRSLSATFIPQLLSMNLLYDRHGAHDDFGDEKRYCKPRSVDGFILVQDLDGFAGRVRGGVPHELVARI